ncbi:hypothetical protein CCACVL1_26270 [Corchorus capsularis]|uniref:Uncharacterized protein n=1 Tax=Corchorus capsularis TaxID=210143 RepID=A0A1R3GFC6_COCAP|nr:hypothetical protein CCACVL1_26270 [Corchorus capsularis]
MAGVFGRRTPRLYSCMDSSVTIAAVAFRLISL